MTGRGRLILVGVLASLALAGCAKVAPNKPVDDASFPHRYPYQPDDLYNGYTPPSPSARLLSPEERGGAAAGATDGETTVIIRERTTVIAPGTTATTPGAAGGMTTTTTSAASTGSEEAQPLSPTPVAPPATPVVVVPRRTVTPDGGVPYPPGYTPR